jgi:hypothetical protein
MPIIKRLPVPKQRPVTGKNKPPLRKPRPFIKGRSPPVAAPRKLRP